MEDYKSHKTVQADEERGKVAGGENEKQDGTDHQSSVNDNYSYDEYDSYSPWEQF